MNLNCKVLFPQMYNNWKNCPVFFPTLLKLWKDRMLRSTSSEEIDLSNIQTKKWTKKYEVQHP